MVFKKTFFILLAAVIQVAAMGQKKTIAGLVTDSVSSQPLSRASIKNILSGIATITKTDGSFTADVSPNQILAFSANGYYTDTLTISYKLFEEGNLSIRLKPLPSTLEDVTVTGSYSRYQNDSITRRRNFLQTVGENKIPVVSRASASDMGFGVGINLDRYGKTETNKRKARSLFEITEEEAYINYRWNEEVVEKYTSLHGDQLTAFMQRNRPQYTWLRKHQTEEDLLYYINERLKKMKKAS